MKRQKICKVSLVTQLFSNRKGHQPKLLTLVPEHLNKRRPVFQPRGCLESEHLLNFPATDAPELRPLQSQLPKRIFPYVSGPRFLNKLPYSFMQIQFRAYLSQQKRRRKEKERKMSREERNKNSFFLTFQSTFILTICLIFLAS